MSVRVSTIAGRVCQSRPRVPASSPTIDCMIMHDGCILCNSGYPAPRHGTLLVGVGSLRSNCVRFRRRLRRRPNLMTRSLLPESATGGLPRPVGWYIFIRCVRDVWFCCRFVGLLCCCCVLRVGGYQPPIQVPRSGFPPLCFMSREYDGGVRPLRVRASLVFLAGPCSSHVSGHEGSTTFPWVAARTVLLVYALSGLRGPVW